MVRHLCIALGHLGRQVDDELPSRLQGLLIHQPEELVIVAFVTLHVVGRDSLAEIISLDNVVDVNKLLLELGNTFCKCLWLSATSSRGHVRLQLSA